MIRVMIIVNSLITHVVRTLTIQIQLRFNPSSNPSADKP